MPGSPRPDPPDEDARVSALRDLDVLDSGTDPVIDELVELLAETCDVPSRW